ncbi:MAG TPA: SRPBCC family protein [Myxococcales bacterium]|nr:SRPBCC family protein [Myxococcales bacterium]
MNRFLDELTGAAGFAATILFSPLLRSKYSTWGSTGEEVKRKLPGDELLPEPALQSTRAISIAAEPKEVWRWIAQMGRNRGGMYSYRVLETPDAHGVIPVFQNIAPGDTILGAARTWRVVEVEFARHLVLTTGISTWTFVLEPLDEARGTRLIVRSRLPAEGIIWKRIIDPGSFVFERRMLMGLREHAEHG